MATTSPGQRQHLTDTNQVHIIKIGGENASDPRTAQWLANFHNGGNRLAVAISALRTKPLNTTTELMRAQAAFIEGGMQSASPILEALYRVHRETLQEANMLDNDLDNKLRILFEMYFPKSLTFEPAAVGQYDAGVRNTLNNLNISNPFDLRYGSQGVLQNMQAAQEQRFIGYGEIMSAHVLSHILDTRFYVANNLLPDMTEVSLNGRNVSEFLRDEVGRRVKENIENGIVIVPGYVGVRDSSILSQYGRGYTDKTAERIAVGLANLGLSPVLHIQKQVPILSSNPNNITHARPISDLSYASAAEITGARGANAQVLNEHTISGELALHDIPVWIYNPFEKDAPKSIVSKRGDPENKILFIDSREHVSTMTISGFSMSGIGLLARLTGAFQKEGISIDSISSSETEVTFTAYGELSESKQSLLKKVLESMLGREYTVTVENNLGLIYCIGDNLGGHPGILGLIGASLASAGIDIECISQSRGQRAITLGVASDHLREATALLHKEFIENT